MRKEIIQVINAEKIFSTSTGMFKPKTNTKALNQVNLTIYEGETLGVVGESGSGKTTLGRCIVGLENLTSGDIKYQDVVLNNKTQSQINEKMQIIFQDPYSALNPTRTALASVMEPLLVKMNREAAKATALKMLALVGIDAEAANKLPRAFSGGQRQRIGIARAVATKPTFILCDEPTSALDVSIQRQVLDLLKELQQKMKLTYLFISHDLSVVRFVSDRIAVMYKGHLVELGPAESVFENPAHTYTKRLLESAPLTDPKEARAQMSQTTSSEIDITLSEECDWIAVGMDHFVRKCR